MSDQQTEQLVRALGAALMHELEARMQYEQLNSDPNWHAWLDAQEATQAARAAARAAIQGDQNEQARQN